MSRFDLLASSLKYYVIDTDSKMRLNFSDPRSEFRLFQARVELQHTRERDQCQLDRDVFLILMRPFFLTDINLI